MSRAAVAAELQEVMGQLTGIAKRGERLAESSGGMVDAVWFRSVQASMCMAAGDLDSKGLLLQPVEPE